MGTSFRYSKHFFTEMFESTVPKSKTHNLKLPVSSGGAERHLWPGHGCEEGLPVATTQAKQRDADPETRTNVLSVRGSG